MAEKKKKKEKTEIKLPKAWATLKHRNETAQARANYEDIWKLVGGVLVAAIVLFVLLGGINQRKAWETLKKWGNNVASAIAGLFGSADVEVNDDGIYLNFDGTSSSVEGSDVTEEPGDESSVIDDESEYSSVEEVEITEDTTFYEYAK